MNSLLRTSPSIVSYQLFLVLYFTADIDAYRINASGCDVLDYASSSDSDVEPVVVSETLRGSFLDDSEDESLQSSQEDPLKYVAVLILSKAQNKKKKNRMVLHY